MRKPEWCTYMDTEFIATDPSERGLISIGITDEQGRDYYAVNAGMDVPAVRTHYWLSKNVWNQLPLNEDGYDLDYTHADVKPLDQIRRDLLRYFADRPQTHMFTWYGSQDMQRLHSLWGGDWGNMPSWIPQWSHELRSLVWLAGNKRIPEQPSGLHHALEDARYNRLLHEVILSW